MLRSFQILMTSTIVASVMLACQSASAQLPVPPASGVGATINSIDFKQQLEKALKARKPTDFDFIAKVVTKVELGILPRKLVDQTMLYARNRSREYPFIYFQFALRKQAEKIGVSL